MKVEKTQQTTVVLLLAVFMIFFVVCVTSCAGRGGAIVVDKATTSSFGVGTVQKIVFAQGKVKKAYLLADRKHAKLPVTREDEDELVITVPNETPDSINTVVVLEIKYQ